MYLQPTDDGQLAQQWLPHETYAPIDDHALNACLQRQMSQLELPNLYFVQHWVMHSRQAVCIDRPASFYHGPVLSTTLLTG